MKGDEKVIEYLNKALKNELTAINQYFLHARMYENWGYAALNEHEYKESIDEMKHADELELEAIPLLRKAIAHCESCNDYVSRELFEDILASEEEHVDWLETQLELIENIGLKNYLQSKM
jgi:bacterioferritin